LCIALEWNPGHNEEKQGSGNRDQGSVDRWRVSGVWITLT